MYWAERIVGASFLLAALGAVWRSLTLGLGSGGGGPGPGLFSFVLGICLGVLSLAWLLTRRDTSRASRFLPERAGMHRILQMLGAQMAFIAIISRVGYQLTAFGFMLFLVKVVGRHKLKVAIPVSAVFSFGLYYVFQSWLEVPLPRSSIGFLRELGL